MPKFSKRQLLRDVAQMQKLLEVLEKYGAEMPDPFVIDGESMSQRQVRERLAAAIKGLLDMQQGIDDAQAKLKRAVVARSEGVRKLRADLGEEILAQFGIGDPEGAADRHTRKVRRRGRKTRT